MGQSVHGSARAFGSHVLRYGFLTIRGKTGGCRVDAPATLARSAEVVIVKARMSILKQFSYAQRDEGGLERECSK